MFPEAPPIPRSVATVRRFAPNPPTPTSAATAASAYNPTLGVAAQTRGRLQRALLETNPQARVDVQTCLRKHLDRNTRHRRRTPVCCRRSAPPRLCAVPLAWSPSARSVNRPSGRHPIPWGHEALPVPLTLPYAKEQPSVSCKRFVSF